jgi:histidinol-phosphate phosphatase family protein
MSTAAMPDGAVPDNGMPSNGMPSSAMPSDAMPSNGMPADGMPALPAWSIVIPTIGRPSLRVLLESLAAQDFDDAGPRSVVVVDDRRAASLPLDVPEIGLDVRVVRSGGRGPAAARNAGWRSTDTAWVEFLDDDVVLPEGWAARFVADLRTVSEQPAAAASQGRLHVPLPAHRPATDWERSTAGLEGARWATADMAYRRAALDAVDGFDERFPRAYREDADLALRVRARGWTLLLGTRVTTHPVRPASSSVSVRVQAGAQDDALMRALHGPAWRDHAQTGRGRFRWHTATVAAAVGGVAALLSGRRRAALLGAGAWFALTVDFLARRVAPGPLLTHEGGPSEWWRMAWTSVVIPFVAVRHRATGAWRHRGVAPAWRPAPRAVLFDRDGTLIEDVPYNGDPSRVRARPGAEAAVEALRSAGVAVGMVTNQSGVARGLLSLQQVERVNARVEELLGPFDVVEVCPHGPEEGCECRKPAGGMVLAASQRLGVAPWECAVVGDIGADVAAAYSAGARAVLVPTPVTLPAEVAAAPTVAPDLVTAVTLLRPDVATPPPRSSSRTSPDEVAA